MPRIRFIHPTDATKALNASLQWVAKSDADVSQLFRVEQVADPVAAPASTQAPVPTPAPTPAPTHTPAPSTAPKTNVVTLGHIVTTETANYPNAAVDLQRVINNTWNAQGLTGEQSVGIQAGSVGVDVRFKWRWAADAREVIAYPEVAYGRSASFEPIAGSLLPRRLSEVNKLVASAQKVEGGGTDGLSHLVYDLWTSNDPKVLSQTTRTAEIMEPVIAWNGYGIPNHPPAAAAGRTGGNGRNPNGYKGRFTIAGVLMDLYYFPPNSPFTGLKWKFIVLVPVVLPGYGAHSIDWAARLKWLVANGYLNGADYLNTVELGVEPVGNGKATAGDVTVRGYQLSIA